MMTEMVDCTVIRPRRVMSTVLYEGSPAMLAMDNAHAALHRKRSGGGVGA